jgi:YidC/Oxa1 family membrane protein insertase
MDKKAWIAITLSVLGMIGWNYYLSTLPQPVKPATPPAANRQPALVEPARPQVVAAATSAAPSAESSAERIEKLTLPQMVVRFTNLGGGIADVTLQGKEHLTENGAHIQINAAGKVPIGALSARPEDSVSACAPYEMRREGNDVFIFERTTPEGIRVTKKFTVQSGKNAEDIPALLMELQYTNTGAAIVRNPGDYLNLGTAVPIHRNDGTLLSEFGWSREGKFTEKNGTWFDAGHIPLLGIETSKAHTVFSQPLDKVEWVSLKNQFYTTILTAQTPKAGQDAPAREIWATRFTLPATAGTPAGTAPALGIEVALGLPAFELAPGASHTETFQIYAGPTRYDRLTQLGRNQDEILKYGWFKPVSLFLLHTMNTFKGWFGNYFWAIVALTVLVKLVTLYPQLKATQSGRRMAALAPKMAELKEKYPDDPARMQQETMKMYREYGVNPFGGCLPALIQMPIFFGFFRMLSNAAELRNSGFLWVHDLSQPDTVAHVLGLPLNPLPLLWGGTMLWQMSLTPKMGDQNQQKMLMYMPLIFVFFCYSFASALSLYYVMQALLTILQLYATRNQPQPVLTRRELPPGGGGLFAGLAAQQKGKPGPAGGGKKKPKQPARLGSR